MHTLRTVRFISVVAAFSLAPAAAYAKAPVARAAVKTAKAPAASKPTANAPAAPAPTPPTPSAPSTESADGRSANGTPEVNLTPAMREARTRYQRGIELFNEGDYKLALIEFEKSNELSPSWRTLYNIGQVHFQLNQYALALKALEQYLEEGKNLPAQRRAEVQKDVEQLRARTALLTVTVNVPDAEVVIDDVSVGKSPIAAAVLVDAGKPKVTVTKQGYQAATKQVTLAGREEKSLAIELVQEPTLVAATSMEPKRPTSYVWVPWAATGALAVGTAVTAVMTLNAKSDRDQLLDRQGLNQGDVDSANDKLKTMSMATNILGGATLVAAGVSIYFTVRGRSASASTEKAQAVRVAPTLGGAVVSGSF